MENIDGIVAEVIVPYGLNIVGAIVILIIGWLIASWASKRVRKACEKSERIDKTLTPILSQSVKVLILIATVIAVLNRFGVETTSLVALLGVAGLAVGLALQGTLSNFSAGVMLMLFRPFNVGDAVNISGVMGVVDEIGLFSTQMHTFDNIFMIVPNSNIWGANISNFSTNPTRRIDMVFGISYTDDINKAMKIIREALDADERVLKDPEPMVAVGELGDSSVDIFVRPWSKASDLWPTRFGLIKDIKERFDKEGISIPFPQRDVHLFQEEKGQK
ncbi:MAG: mechanosensitive ion channel family protein [Balneolaceae bacterium]|nr:MAG: mechanosensitive ion channel family protein [Balneolaceae bacterium]